MYERPTEATYSNGVLKPDEPLNLREHERVRLIVQSIESPANRADAIERFRAGRAATQFKSNGKYPSRGELHDRD